VKVEELQAEVAKALNFDPPLDRFVLLTTGPNDARLKEAAARLSKQHRLNGLFEVQVHGWDWVEAKLSDHMDLAIDYGLIAVVAAGDTPRQTASRIAQQIGGRLLAAVHLMNKGRRVEDIFTLQSLSHHLGLPDWRRLEQISEGRSDADTAELTSIADGLGLSRPWLLEGKGAPFVVDLEGYHDATGQYDAIRRMKPQRIVFVRERGEPNDSIVVAQLDDARWFTFRFYHPSGPNVGGTGRQQLFEYCCLMRRVYRKLERKSSGRCFGRHLDSTDFLHLLEGEVYPGTLLNRYQNDHWWDDFAELAEHRVRGDSFDCVALREAIHIARGVLIDFQERASRDGRVRRFLSSIGFPATEATSAADYNLDVGIR